MVLVVEVVEVVEVLPVLSSFQVLCVTVVLQQNLVVVRVMLPGKRGLLLGKMMPLHGTTILVVFLAFAAVVKLFHSCLREAHIPVDLFVVVLHVVTFVRH